MKRLLISFAILILIGGVYFFGVGYINSNYEKITGELEKGEKYIQNGDIQNGKKHCAKAERMYTESEQYLSIFVNHGTLDDIGVTISAVFPLADKDSVPECLSHIAQAKVSLKHLYNDHAFIMKNLF